MHRLSGVHREVSPPPLRTLSEAEAIAGVLGQPSKMPCWSYGLPARHCVTGSVLAQLPNTVCSQCYALRGNYHFSGVQSGLERRWRSLTHPRWVEAMVFMIHYRECAWFRWHDSGDLQSLEHLENIVAVARQCPRTRFWLPTREKAMVQEYLRKHGAFPRNLLVRVSAALIDGPPPEGFRHTSTVVTSGATCPAPLQGNQCLDCRACWDPRVRNVAYKKH